MEKKSIFPDIGDDFEILTKLKEGGFGEVFLAKNKKSNQEVVVKLEKNVIKARLVHEIRIYQYLAQDPCVKAHIPSIHFYGENNFEDYMVMDYMGLNLQQLLKLCGGKFSLKTVLMIADQMLERVQFIHSKGILHRDIKPDNFVIGRGEDNNKVFLIDFGSSDSYLDSQGRHIPWAETDPFMMATVLFASINNHLWQLPFRKDDLESLGFCLCYFLKGRLPWQGLIGERIEYRTRSMKMHELPTVYEELPEEFEAYVRYCRKIDWCEEPDYNFLKNLFKKLFINKGFELDYIYDWVPLLNKKVENIAKSESEP